MTIDKSAINSLADRAVYLVLDWSFLGTWKHVVTPESSTELKTTKRTIKSDSIGAMRRLNYHVRSALRHYALNSLFRPGVYVIPLESVQHIDDVLQLAVTDMEAIREQIVSEWPEIIQDGRDRLGDLFDASDYGSGESAAKEFEMSYRYAPIAETPTILKHVAADTYKADLERTRKETEKELQTFRDSLRITLLEIVENMRKTLTKPDGEKRVFGARFFKRLNEFLETFDGKNLSDDAALQDVVQQLQLVSNGTDVATLKTSADMQQSLDTSLSQITESMASMLQDDDGRMIDLSQAS